MTSFDLIGAIAEAAAAATVVCVLVMAAFSNVRSRLGAGGVLAGWFALIVAAAALPTFDQRDGIGIPALGVAVAAPVILGLLLTRSWPRLRDAVRAVPTSVLIAVNSVRVLGVLFVLLYLLGRLPAPFAPMAGYGDIAVGATAPVIAWLAARQVPGWRGATWLWNGFGTLDLLTAIGLGVVSAAGSPLRLIVTMPDSGLMTDLPWILIPGFLVPLLMLVHIALFDRLLRTRVASPRQSRAVSEFAS
jgi:hypothetical protein